MQLARGRKHCPRVLGLRAQQTQVCGASYLVLALHPALPIEMYLWTPAAEPAEAFVIWCVGGSCLAHRSFLGDLTFWQLQGSSCHIAPDMEGSCFPIRGPFHVYVL